MDQSTVMHPAVWVISGGGFTFACTLAGKIIWDWLKNRRNGTAEVPHAGNGFMTLNELTAHCRNQQNTCTKLMRAEFKIIKTEIKARLDQGDRTFKGLSTQLTEQGEVLTDLQEKVSEIAENGKHGRKKAGGT